MHNRNTRDFRLVRVGWLAAGRGRDEHDKVLKVPGHIGEGDQDLDTTADMMEAIANFEET